MFNANKHNLEVLFVLNIFIFLKIILDTTCDFTEMTVTFTLVLPTGNNWVLFDSALMSVCVCVCVYSQWDEHYIYWSS